MGCIRICTPPCEGSLVGHVGELKCIEIEKRRGLYFDSSGMFTCNFGRLIDNQIGGGAQVNCSLGGGD